MNRKQIYDLVVETLESIQELSGQKKVDVNEDTVPIGQLPGFDSMNGVEFSMMISKHIPMEKIVSLCVSDDGKKALSVHQIVEWLEKLWDVTRGGKKDAKGQ
jgi:acyl carrier protein